MLDNDFRQIFNPCVKQDRLNKAKDGLNTGTSNIYWAAYASFMKIAPNTTGQIRIILAICCALSAAVEPANAQTWIPATVPTNYWSCVASSADGTKLAVAGSGYINGMETSYIYNSTNSGAAWMPSVAPTNYVWNSIASSANGTKLVVTTGSFFPTSGKIYVSTNSGITWTEVTPTNLYWASVASSADGTKLAAVGSPGFTGGFVYTSTNSGTTWTQQTNAPNIGWFSIISSADGSKLVVQVPDTIYGSTNSGVTWAQITPPPILWPGRSSSQVIASSADGTRLFAAFNGGSKFESVSGLHFNEFRKFLDGDKCDK
jgi:hypothetical protein